MPEPTESGARLSENSAIPAASPRTGDGRFQKGESGNPGGRPRHHELDRLLELKLADVDLADELIKLVKKGDLAAIKYCYDRLAGQPVQRHEAKLEYEIKEHARALAKEHGLSEEEVIRQAEAILRGKQA